MNVQFTMQSIFSNPAILALMIIPITSATTLLIPIWPIVGIESAPPCRVCSPAHAVAVCFSETRSTAIEVLVTLTVCLVWLKLKHLATSGAGNVYSWCVRYGIVCGLPSTPTFPATKIALTYSTRRNPLFLAAHGTRNIHLGMSASRRTVHGAAAFDMPVCPLKLFSASQTFYNHFTLLRSCYFSYYTIKETSFAGVASEMIGAMLAGWDEVTGIELEAEHVAIGQARLAWWSEMARKLGSDDPATILEMADGVAEATSIFDLLDAA